VEIQDVEFNNNGKLQDEHSFSFTPKHSKHLLLQAIYLIIYLIDVSFEFSFSFKYNKLCQMKEMKDYIDKYLK